MITALSVFHIPSPSPFGSTMTAITQTWLHPPPPPFLFLHLCLKDSDHIEALNLSSSLTLSGNGQKTKKKKQNITIMAETEGPWRIVGTVQAWGKLLFPWQQWSPLSHRPHPRPRAPLHLNSHCAKLFCSDFHLPPLLPHPLTVLSPHPAPTPHTHLPHHRPCPPTFRPDPQTGTKTGSKMREPHPPTRCSQCPTLSYVTKDESEMPVIGWCTSSGDICIMAFIMMFYGSDNSVNTARPNPGCHLCGLSLKLVSVFI